MPETVTTPSTPSRPRTTGTMLALAVAWLWVGVPLAWGVILTVKKSLALFS
jgi:hypothetical protein